MLTKSGSWEFNLATKEFTWSDGMYCIFGIDKNLPVTAEIFVGYAVEEDKLIAMRMVDILQNNFHQFEETFRIHAAGSTKTIKTKASCFKTEKKQIGTIVGVCVDVSQLVKQISETSKH